MFNSKNLKNKRVFLRADLNTKSTNGEIKNDHRLQAILPTIDELLKRGAKIILATHVGRPKKPTPELSTKNLLKWFEKRKYAIDFEPDFNKAHEKSLEKNNTILLLENMRFFPGEQSSDQKEREKFCDQLAPLADLYVNDAFGLLHRNDTSITDLPKKFDTQNRTLGLLVKKELLILGNLLSNAQKPFLCIFGGGKVSTKIPLMRNLISKVDAIALCPAIVFTFLKVHNKPVGKSLVDEHALDDAQQIIKEAKEKNVSLLFPTDYLVSKNKIGNPLIVAQADNFPHDAIGVSIGPETAQHYTTKIKEAKTIFYNGLSGFHDQPESLQEIAKLFKAMNESKGTTIIAGGDSVAIAQQLGFDKNISHLSTGGGSVMAYLSGKELPGLVAFTQHT